VSDESIGGIVVGVILAIIAILLGFFMGGGFSV